MAAGTIVHRKSDAQVAEATVFTLEDGGFRHPGETFAVKGEEVGMAHAAIHPVAVRGVGKDRRCDSAHFCLKGHDFGRDHGRARRVDVAGRGDDLALDRSSPVDAIAEFRRREAFLHKLGKLGLFRAQVAAVAARATLLFLHGKSEFAVMAGAAKAPLAIVGFRHRGGTDTHIEFQLAVTDPAARFGAVEPVRKDDRFNPFRAGSPIHEEGAIFMGRREGREGIPPGRPEPGRGRAENSEQQEEDAEHLHHRFGVAALTVTRRKGDLAVTGATVAAGKEIDHGVAVRPLFDADEDIGMARFTASPQGVLFVGKDDLRHPFGLCRQVEVFAGGDGFTFDRNFFEGVDQLGLPFDLGFFPVNAIAEALFGEAGAKGDKFLFFLP